MFQSFHDLCFTSTLVLYNLVIKEVNFPLAFLQSGRDPINRALINQNQALALRGGIPEDVVPRHVSGGIPIQRYLQTLLDRMPEHPVDPMFELVSRVNDQDLHDLSAASQDLDALDDPEVNRNFFIDNMRDWMDRHVRVKVSIEGVDRSCYVWQSFLEPPRPAGGSVASSDTVSPASGEEGAIDPLERNILESDSSDSDSDAVADTMFNR